MCCSFFILSLIFIGMLSGFFYGRPYLISRLSPTFIHWYNEVNVNVVVGRQKVLEPTLEIEGSKSWPFLGSLA